MSDIYVRQGSPALQHSLLPRLTHTHATATCRRLDFGQLKKDRNHAGSVVACTTVASGLPPIDSEVALRGSHRRRCLPYDENLPSLWVLSHVFPPYRTHKLSLQHRPRDYTAARKLAEKHADLRLGLASSCHTAIPAAAVWGENELWATDTPNQFLVSPLAMAHHDFAGGFGEPGSELSLLGSVLSRCGSTGLLGEKEVAGGNAL